MLSDRYDELVPIGEGVSARVYKAVDRRTASAVAIKVLNPHLQTDEISLERFKREIQITRFLGHPQIVSIYDLVVEPDRIYMVMEYIEGLDLKDFIRLRHPVDADTALGILKQALEILSVCHAKNVIHRDLKPQNMMVDRHGTVRLLDFGISRMTTLSDLTQTGTSLGSPEYMAPELFATNTYDPRSDVYALGVIFFELLTGELPFKGDSLPVLCHEHLTRPVPSLRALRPDLPGWYQPLAEKMLAKQAYERYQSVDEALADIERERVVSRDIPQLERRECLACGVPTLDALSRCTACGRDAALALASGSVDLWCAEGSDPDAVARFCRVVFGATPPRRQGASTLLISDLDARSAELLRQSGLRHGVTLSMRERPRFAAARGIGALLACLWCAQYAAVRIAICTQPFAGDFIDPTMELLLTAAQAVLFLIAAWFFLGLARRQFTRPAFRQRDAVQVHVASELGWLGDIVFRTTSPGLQQALARMIEKYLLLWRADVALDADLKTKLRGVLESAADVASAAAEIEQVLESSALGQQTATYAALTGQIAVETDGPRREQLRKRRAACASVLERVYALQDSYAALANRLVHLQAVFNTLLGKAIVLRQPLDAAENALLGGCLESLKGDLGVARQVHAELRRVA